MSRQCANPVGFESDLTWLAAGLQSLALYAPLCPGTTLPVFLRLLWSYLANADHEEPDQGIHLGLTFRRSLCNACLLLFLLLDRCDRLDGRRRTSLGSL